MPERKYSLRGERIDPKDPLAEKYGTLMAELLYSRNIKNIEDAEKFLAPDLNTVSGDPFLIPDIEKAIIRIHNAIEGNEKITIHADYDCDGIPGAVIISKLFQKINYANYDVSIPDRNIEGYGLAPNHINKIKENNSILIITVDLGISANESVIYAKSLGIDTIITDHHTIPNKRENIPNAYAVVHPGLIDSQYPHNDLCGAGVAYKLVDAFCKRYYEFYKIEKDFANNFIDLVAFATISDMVPLRVENRALVRDGIKLIRKAQRPGLRALASASRVYLRELTQDDISFMLAPKLNVASRMGSAYDAYNLLMSDNESEAKETAEKLKSLSDERRVLVAQMVKQAKRNIAEDNKENHNVIVVGNPAWRVGLLGLVASRVAELYGKPSFVWGAIEGDDGSRSYKGSCRGNGTINMYTLMSMAPSETFLDYGGHNEAGGFGIHPEAIYDFENILNRTHMRASEDGHSSEKENIFIDAVLPLSLVSKKLFKCVESLAPFGTGNPPPLFIIKNLELLEVRNFGKDKAHIEIVFRNNDGQTRSAYTYFKGLKDFDENITINSKFHLVAELDQKSDNVDMPKLRIKDLIYADK